MYCLKTRPQTQTQVLMLPPPRPKNKKTPHTRAVYIYSQPTWRFIFLLFLFIFCFVFYVYVVSYKMKVWPERIGHPHRRALKLNENGRVSFEQRNIKFNKLRYYKWKAMAMGCAVAGGRPPPAGARRNVRWQSCRLFNALEPLKVKTVLMKLLI